MGASVRRWGRFGINRPILYQYARLLNVGGRFLLRHFYAVATFTPSPTTTLAAIQLDRSSVSHSKPLDAGASRRWNRSGFCAVKAACTKAGASYDVGRYQL